MTRLGWWVVGLCLGLFGIGIALGYAPLTLLAIFLGALHVVAWMITLRRPALEAERVLTPSHVSCGSPARASLQVTNISGRPASGLTGVESVGSTSVSLDVPRLPVGESQSIEYDIPTLRRGVVRVGPVSFLNRDPWGLWLRSRSVPGHADLFVRPRTHALVSPGRGIQRALDGGETTRTLEGSSTFHALREYVPGDDRRRIHWRSSARTGTLMVKQHVDLARPEVLLAIDVSSPPGDAIEEYIEIAASLGTVALRERNPVRLVTSDGHEELFESPEQEAALLDALTVLEVGQVGAGSAWLAATAAQRTGSTALVASTQPRDELAAASGFLTSRYSTVAVSCIAPEPSVIVTRGVYMVSAPDAVGLAAVWNSRFAS